MTTKMTTTKTVMRLRMTKRLHGDDNDDDDDEMTTQQSNHRPRIMEAAEELR